MYIFILHRPNINHYVYLYIAQFQGLTSMNIGFIQKNMEQLHKQEDC